MTAAAEILSDLNNTYARLHSAYEELFWVSKMGDHSVDEAMNKALYGRDAFRADAANLARVNAALTSPETSSAERGRLEIWRRFFALYQTPSELISLRDQISRLETSIEERLASQKEGYRDPATGSFVEASKLKMRMIVRTNPKEEVRRACFQALEELAPVVVEDYVKLVGLRNQYARALGFPDFYAYKAKLEEGMSKDEIFKPFNDIYEQTHGAFEHIRALEPSMPGLRKPWNFSYLMTGDFTKEEDPYYEFDDALRRWGRSFAALGINYRGGTLQLDLLDRKGKYNNGFCHYPRLVRFENEQRQPGAANFTCNVVYRQVGAAFLGMHTLFHEGGHAADRLNSQQRETCLNTEYPPASTSWAETHSQFLDEMYASVEWRSRYAKKKDGTPYPFDLFKRKVRKLRILAPLYLHSIMALANFEKQVYEASGLNPEKVLEIARTTHRKYFDYSEDTASILATAHLYSWESACSYHAYGLAELALMQWREYFFDKYGYIVDNPGVGREMTEVWKLGSLKTFAEFVKLATGKALSAGAFLQDVLLDETAFIAKAKKRVERLASVPEHHGPIELNATIRMTNGPREVIADNSKSFEEMAEQYAAWLNRSNP